MNVLRVFTASVAFFCIFATFTKISNLENFSKNPVLFHTKPNIWTCLEVLLFRSHSTLIYYIYQFLKNWKKTPKTQLCFKKTQNLNVLRILIFRTLSTSILLPLAICKETMFYYWKIQLFQKKKQILHVLRIFTTSVAFYGKFATININKYNQIF